MSWGSPGKNSPRKETKKEFKDFFLPFIILKRKAEQILEKEIKNRWFK